MLQEKETSKAEKLAGAGGWKKGGKKKKVVLSVEDVLRMEKEHDFVHEGEKKTVSVPSYKFKFALFMPSVGVLLSGHVIYVTGSPFIDL